MGSFIPPILTFTHFIMEVYSTLNAPLAYLSFLHILFFLPSPVKGRGLLVTCLECNDSQISCKHQGRTHP